MKYAYKLLSKISFDDTLKKIREELSEEGFGILTEINVQETMKKKLGVDVDKQIILGACNPTFAHKALNIEQDVGVLLPCNITVYEKKEEVYLSSILPTEAMSVAEYDELTELAQEIEQKIVRAMNKTGEQT